MAMSGPRDTGGMVSDINVTPLVDVMLVLLIIFMVAAPMVTTGVPVSLPKAEAQAVESDEGKLILTIPEAFARDSIVYLGRSPVRFDELAVKLGANEKLRMERELYIHADRNLRYDDVVRVMAVASKAGAEKLGLITDPLQTR
ncbi:MAG: ExbD/TolR family protein [Myxococcales bacterium]|nr:ExbD/TolR family protein [Myxococcota bacterium]MDW8283973.1 ExbD/TolR family protein [Myxococcales bacterium]